MRRLIADTKIKKTCFRTLAVLLVVISMVTVFAWADTFEGWNEETKEEAWTTYAITEWSETGNFVFDENGSVAKSTVPDTFRTMTVYTGGYSGTSDDYTIYTYESLCQAVVSQEINGTTGEQYSELLLSILYVMYCKSGNHLLQSADPTGYYPYLTDSEDNISDSVLTNATRIYKRLLTCITVYEAKYDSVSIYSNDEALGMVIQGVIYGTAYAKAYESYSVDNAKEFSDNATTFIAAESQGWNNFASEVQSYYQALTSNGHYIVG